MHKPITKEDLFLDDILKWNKSYIKTSKKAYKLSKKLNKELEKLKALKNELPQ